jgi:predicted TIM-barrel fold metal-dependent hydrolase
MKEGVPPDVVDAHTHAFPPEWVLDRSELVRRDRWFGELFAAASVKMIDAGALLLAMDAAGVAQAVVCGWPWADPALCRTHNDYLAATATESGGRLAWLGVVAPGSSDAAAETERCLSLGASGIGELNADAQGFDLTRPEALADVAAVLIAAERPLMLHASEPVGRLYLGKGAATPDRIIRLVEAFPQLSLVLAHWGGGLPFYELMPEIAAVTRNVVYDTAASAYLYRGDVFRTVIEIAGAERVLWASDHPVLGMRRFLRQTRQLANLQPDEEHAIMAGNARRVYRLPERSLGTGTAG